MTQQLISNLKRDRLLTKCENLILQGIDSPTDISDTLKISFNTAKSYVTIVRSRWVTTSSIDELQTKRQELIKKTEAIVRESWQLKGNAKNTLEAVGALRTALMAIERLEKLQGLDTLPLPVEPSTEAQMFTFAQEINILPPDEKDYALQLVREELSKRSSISSR